MKLPRNTLALALLLGVGALALVPVPVLGSTPGGGDGTDATDVPSHGRAGLRAAEASEASTGTVGRFRVDPGLLGIPGLSRRQDEQEAAPEAAPGSQGVTTLRVFLDCTGGGFGRGPCRDQDFLRREITFVDYVRDRQDSDVHVLVTGQRAGASTEYRLAFIGQGRFEGDDVTHVYNASDTNTDDETRRGFADVLRVGFLHYVVQTPLFSGLQLDVRETEARAEQQVVMATAEEDPWNFWVFRVSVRGEYQKEDRQSRRNVRLDLSANRTTEAWKLRIGTDFRYDEETFTLGSGEEVLSFTRDYSVTQQTVKSMGDHWGLSLKVSAAHATFVNQGLTTVVAPGIEYNIFPYEESSQRQLTFTYEVGAAYYQYEAETLFEETEEFLPDQVFLVNYDVNQPWGQANFGLETAQFLNHLGQWRVVVDGRLDFRITRGLSFNVNGQYASIRDQRFLPAEELSDEDVLLERQQLATNSQYDISFGITYRFGSIFNNVVNPRFAGSRGGFDRYF